MCWHDYFSAIQADLESLENQWQPQFNKKALRRMRTLAEF